MKQDLALEQDIAIMSLALEEARKARFDVSPRPWVGCAIVANPDDDLAIPKKEIFLGFTQGKAGMHAESHALKKAGQKSLNAHLYATLEPCRHKCVKAIIDAGIAKVFVAIKDPDPRVAGKGIADLKEAGIQVELGICEEQATKQLEPYLFQRQKNRPFVVLKLAASLDGRIAASNGASHWITGPQARADGHQLRGESDAILVGSNTLKLDNPALTVRDFQPKDIEVNKPLRVVLTSKPKSISKQAKAQPLITLSGSPTQILQALHKRGVMQVLIEGGASVAYDFHSAGLINKYVFYFAPKLFSDDLAKPMLSHSNPPSSQAFDVPENLELKGETLGEIWSGKIEAVHTLGEDLKIEMSPNSQIA